MFGFVLEGRIGVGVGFGGVLFERERMPWSQRDSSRKMPEASFLDTGTFLHS